MSALEFNSLLLSNADYLRPFAITLTRDHESANDLMQDTMFKALANREKFHAGTNIKAWLYTIMRNIFINSYRRRSLQQTIFDHSENGYLLDNNQSAVANGAESQMQLQQIKKACHELPAIFKKPFMLFVDGYKYHEIADMLQEPLGTVKSRIHFARKLLKAQLERQ